MSEKDLTRIDPGEEFSVYFSLERGESRKVTYSPIPGSSYWSRTVYELENGDWRPKGGGEVKYPSVELPTEMVSDS